MSLGPDQSQPGPDAAPLVGQSVGKYRITRVVGRGGMGTVYEAVNTAIGKRVAMKFIDAALAGSEEAVARFQREALAASAVESPHIVQIFDAGTGEDGAPYLVMELLRGSDLGAHISRLGRLDLAETLPITAQILRGLHHAHAAGIVHRDLKPDNVFLVEREDEPLSVKLLDFGVSKIAFGRDVPLQTLTRQGTVVGTPYYMSPEQAQACPDVDGRSDVYSVGAILYECLSGRPPHMGRSYEQVIVNICTKDPEDIRLHNPAVPEPVARVLAKALARERDERYGSARELLVALASAAPDALKATLALGSGQRPGVSVSGAGTSRPELGSGMSSTVRRRAEAETVAVDSLPASRHRRLWLLGAGAALVVAASAVAVLAPGRGRPPGDAAPSATAAAAAARDSAPLMPASSASPHVTSAAPAASPAAGESAAEATAHAASRANRPRGTAARAGPSAAVADAPPAAPRPPSPPPAPRKGLAGGLEMKRQ